MSVGLATDAASPVFDRANPISDISLGAAGCTADQQNESHVVEEALPA